MEEAPFLMATGDSGTKGGALTILTQSKTENTRPRKHCDQSRCANIHEFMVNRLSQENSKVDNIT